VSSSGSLQPMPCYECYTHWL